MIKVAGKEALYSTSLILQIGETAVVTPSELAGSVIEITVEQKGVPASGLELPNLNHLKLSIATDNGFSNAYCSLHTQDLVIYDVRIHTQTFGDMVRVDVQVTKGAEIKF